MNPTELPGHLFPTNTSRNLVHLTITPSNRGPCLPSPPTLKSCPQGILTPLITIPRILSWIIPILRSDCWVPAGHDCRHRWESRPVMTSICHIALLSRCVFFKCFSFHLSSLSLFCSLKPLDQGGRGEHLRRWKRSNLMPINKFSCKAGTA